MADPPDGDSYDDIDPPSGEDTGAPRWVKAFAIIGLVLVVLFVVLLLVGGGNHGPGRHATSRGPDSQVAPVSSVVQTAASATAPADSAAPGADEQ